MPTPNNPITPDTYFIVTPGSQFISKAYGNLNGTDLFFYVSDTQELRVVNFTTSVVGNTTFVLANAAIWVSVISVTGMVHVYYADLGGQIWYIPYTLFGGSAPATKLNQGSAVTFSCIHTPQSTPPAYIMMIDDGIKHNLFVAADPKFQAAISTLVTYNNSFNPHVYVTRPIITMHPSDTNRLTVHTQQITVLTSVSQVGWYVVVIPGLQ